MKNKTLLLTILLSLMTVLFVACANEAMNSNNNNNNNNDNNSWEQTYIYLKKKDRNDKKLFFTKAELLAAGEDDSDYDYYPTYIHKNPKFTKLIKIDHYNLKTNELNENNYDDEYIIHDTIESLYKYGVARINNQVICCLHKTDSFTQLSASNAKWISYFDDGSSFTFYRFSFEYDNLWEEAQIYIKKRELNDKRIYFSKNELLAAGELEYNYLLRNAYINNNPTFTKMTYYEVYNYDTKEEISYYSRQYIFSNKIEDFYSNNGLGIINNRGIVTTIDDIFYFDYNTCNRVKTCYFDDGSNIHLYYNR